ncbi:MAG: HD-GYP domain-containing protein [Bacillota bacterium]
MKRGSKSRGRSVVEKIRVEELTPGMELARDVEYKYGSIIIPRGSILDEKNISRLQEMEINVVHVLKQDEDQLQKNMTTIKNIEDNYQKSTLQMSEIFKKVRQKQKIEGKEVKEITHEITVLGDDKDMIDVLTRIRDADEYTYHHLLNVGILAYMFGNWLNFDEERCLHLAQSGLLHDIGKARIPDSILNKPGQLTENEYEIIKKHALYSYKMAVDLDFVAPETARGVLTHHERYNGSGYPLQLKEGSIPLFGRILAIVDTFDAVTAERIYQPSSSPFAAIKLFHEETLGAFDFSLVNIFLDNIPDYFVREKVILNDGRKAEVVFINPRHPDKPIIKVDDNYIDLYNNGDLDIESLSEN